MEVEGRGRGCGGGQSGGRGWGTGEQVRGGIRGCGVRVGWS